MEAGKNKNESHAGQESDAKENIPEEIATTAGIDHSTDETPVRRHQEHGNRKYKMFKNHSSADDQPRTNTGL